MPKVAGGGRLAGSLGVEALDRFVRREPAYRVHECVFGVLALESEPVDPR
jgi:PNKP adenylyltransferase domain, ligase domain